jgi:uncharacterized membrane protein YhaH (DUF805 family)
MGWLLNPYKGYVVITNRAGRREFWTFIRFNAVIILPLYVLSRFGDEKGSSFEQMIDQFSPVCTFLLLSYSISIVIPLITLAVRRLHDQDKSGWYLWALLVPYGGIILILSYMLTESDIGPNSFGEDPIDRIYYDELEDISYFSTAGYDDPARKEAS